MIWHIVVWVLAVTGALTWLAVAAIAVLIAVDDPTEPSPPPSLLAQIDPVTWEKRQAEQEKREAERQERILELAYDAAFPLKTRDEVMERLPVEIRRGLGDPLVLAADMARTNAERNRAILTSYGIPRVTRHD